jgi:Fe-S-cluster-containing hydrogenase component 2
VDFESLRAVGAVMGSGGMIVVDDTTCMVDFARFFMQFICDECCGKCPPCRIGSLRLLEVLERITAGDGRPKDLDEIRYLASSMQTGCLCALGQLAPSPVLSTLEHFEAEYRTHIEERRCSAGKCPSFRRRLVARPELCTACRLCELACAVEHSCGKTVMAAMLELPPPRPRLYVETAAAAEATVTLSVCHHCDPASCIMACVPQAMHRASVDGAVTNIGGRTDCIACSMCVMACPFGMIARGPAPNGRIMALKCDLCPGRDVPACVAACPTGALALKRGADLLPMETTTPAIASDTLVSLAPETIASVLHQLEPGAVEVAPTAAAATLLSLLDRRRNGFESQVR